MTTKIFSKQEWEDLKIKARREIGFCDIKEYSHNLIGMYMMGMDKDQMEQFATELQLGRIGWVHLDSSEDNEISDDDKRQNEVAYKLRRMRMKSSRRT